MITNRNSLRDFGRIENINNQDGTSLLRFGALASRGSASLVPIATDTLVATKGAELTGRDCFWAEVTVAPVGEAVRLAHLEWMAPEGAQ